MKDINDLEKEAENGGIISADRIKLLTVECWQQLKSKGSLLT